MKDKTDKQIELEVARRNLKRATLLASISSFLLMTGLSVTFPFYQARRDVLECSTLCYGSLTSARSMLALVGSAVIGRLSDSQLKNGMNGRNICLFLGIAATLTGLVISVLTNSIRGLWWAMIPGALLQQNFSVFKALLADHHQVVSTLEEDMNGGVEVNKSEAASARAGSVGKLGMAVGIAFMVGPLAGATLIETYETSIVIAIALTLSSTICILQLPTMEPSRTSNKSNGIADDTTTSKSSWTSTVLKLLDVPCAKTPAGLLLILIRVSMSLAYHIFNTIWTVSLKHRFDFGPSDHGKFMSFVGLVFAFSQGFFAKRILAPMGQKGRIHVILTCCVVLGMGRYIAFQVTSLSWVYVMFGFIVTALGVMNTVLTADASIIAPSSEIGGLYGVLEAAQSGAGMLGPVLGGSLAYIHPVSAPLTAVVLLYALVFVSVLVWYDRLILDGTNAMEDGAPSNSEYTSTRSSQERRKKSL